MLKMFRWRNRKWLPSWLVPKPSKLAAVVAKHIEDNPELWRQGTHRLYTGVGEYTSKFSIWIANSDYALHIDVENQRIDLNLFDKKVVWETYLEWKEVQNEVAAIKILTGT